MAGGVAGIRTAEYTKQCGRTRSPVFCREVSELETVRIFTRLSHLNFSIDTHFYRSGRAR